MKLVNGQYVMLFENGGVQITKNGKLLYFNARPVYVSVKTIAAVSLFSDISYENFEAVGDTVVAKGSYESKNGSAFAVCDVYRVEGEDFKVEREVTVLKKAEEDLGFQTKLGFWAKESDAVADYNYFSPGEWYKHNEYAPSYAQGKNMDATSFIRLWSRAP